MKFRVTVSYNTWHTGSPAVAEVLIEAEDHTEVWSNTLRFLSQCPPANGKNSDPYQLISVREEPK